MHIIVEVASFATTARTDVSLRGQNNYVELKKKNGREGKVEFSLNVERVLL
jgi:hypothetical protein